MHECAVFTHPHMVAHSIFTNVQMQRDIYLCISHTETEVAAAYIHIHRDNANILALDCWSSSYSAEHKHWHRAEGFSASALLLMSVFIRFSLISESRLWQTLLTVHHSKHLIYFFTLSGAVTLNCRLRFDTQALKCKEEKVVSGTFSVSYSFRTDTLIVKKVFSPCFVRVCSFAVWPREFGLHQYRAVQGLAGDPWFWAGSPQTWSPPGPRRWQRWRKDLLPGLCQSGKNV